MSIHRRVTYSVIIAALTALAPAAAGANSLLSGYGGPGQGSQAILGSGLINGGGGGGSGRGSGGGSSSSSAAPSVAQAVTSPTVSSGSTRRSSGHRRAAAAKRSGSPVGRIPATSAEGAYPASFDGGSQTARVASDPLGVSSADLLYILVAAGALVLTGLLTRQLTQTAQKPSNAQTRFDRTARH
jgi:hypothetical protein